MTYGTYQRIAPRVRVLRGFAGNEPQSRTLRAPITSGVTIKSGQVISLSSGSWVLGCATGKEPFIAFADSSDTDVISAGLLLGLSCSGQFTIETPYFDNTATYVEGSPLIAGTSNSTPTASSSNAAIQAGPYLGNLTLGTLSTAEDTVGFARNGGRQNYSAIATNGSAVNSEATFLSSSGAVLNVYVLQFNTHWLPRATTSS